MGRCLLGTVLYLYCVGGLCLHGSLLHAPTTSGTPCKHLLILTVGYLKLLSVSRTQYEQNSLKLAWDTLIQEVLTDAEVFYMTSSTTSTTTTSSSFYCSNLTTTNKFQNLPEPHNLNIHLNLLIISHQSSTVYFSNKILVINMKVVIAS